MNCNKYEKEDEGGRLRCASKEKARVRSNRISSDNAFTNLLDFSACNDRA